MFELHPKTKKLLEEFAAADYGAEFSYAEILQSTGCDLLDGDRQRIYTVIRRLERDHRRTLMNLRGRGYRVAKPGEHVESMRVRTGRAKRHMALARRTGDATPLDLLDDSERRTLADQMAFNSHVVQALRYQSSWNRDQDERIAAIEDELRQLRSRDVVEGVAFDEAVPLDGVGFRSADAA